MKKNNKYIKPLLSVIPITLSTTIMSGGGDIQANPVNQEQGIGGGSTHNIIGRRYV